MLLTQKWDSNGRPDETAFGQNGTTTKFGYDDVSRLNSFGHDFFNDSHNFNIGFMFLPSNQVWEREFSNSNYVNNANDTLTGNYQVNGLNQYRCQGNNESGCSGSDWIHYDDNGNLRSFKGASLVYDELNRLISRTEAGKTAVYSYDPMGRLVKATFDGDTTEFLYDGDALVAEFDGAGEMQYRYVHGSRVDNPLVSYQGSAVSNSNRRFLHSDHQGSIVAHSDNSGNRKQHNTYDEYGIPGDNNDGRFAYTGQIHLPYSDLYHYKARVYHPRLGRFLQTDPVGYEDQINLYAYVANDPMTMVDPTGEFGILGVIVGAGFEVGLQVVTSMGEGNSFSESMANLDVGKVAVAAALGSVGGVGGNLMKAAVTGKMTAGVGASKVSLELGSKAERVIVGAQGAAIGGTAGAAQAGVRGQDMTNAGVAKVVDGVTSPVPVGSIINGAMENPDAVSNAMDKAQEFIEDKID